MTGCQVGPSASGAPVGCHSDVFQHCTRPSVRVQ